MRTMLLVAIFFLSGCLILAQNDPLTVESTEIETRLDAFGVQEEVLHGVIVNNSNRAYNNVSVLADVLDDDGEVIGEAFGFMVDACGIAILDDAILPDETARFLATMDIFDDGDIEDFDFIITGSTTEPEPAPEVDLEGVTEVSSDEVVALEWEDESTFRYGVGCDTRVFNTYDWYRYNIIEEENTELDDSPDTPFITEAFIRQTGINQLTQTRTDDPTLFQLSFLTFSPYSTRVIWQTDLRNVITAEQDGSFKRVTYTGLHQYSLQGFVWSPNDNFVAYYFGAYGEPVQYFTASASGGLISATLSNNTPSVTVPGLINDARRVIIGGEFPDAEGNLITGYWYSSVITQQRELLFEVDELPGNNYPAPTYYRKDDNTRYIYVVRPENETVILQCYFSEGDELHTLTELPLQLENDERAWMWLSPDYNTLAIGANGTHGGLWLVDLNHFDVCQ